MPAPTTDPMRKKLPATWYQVAERWSVLLHASPAEAERVATGAPYVLAPAATMSRSSLLGKVVEECAVRWGVVPEGGDSPICPHLHASLQKRAVWVGSVPPMPDALALKSAFMPILDMFDALEAVSGSRLTSVVVVVPFDDEAHGSSIVETAHRAVKSAALERGLLPGEFGRTLAGPGSRYADISTRKSEVAEYLALRRLLRQDRKYCDHEPTWLRRFEAMFGEAS